MSSNFSNSNNSKKLNPVNRRRTEWIQPIRWLLLISGFVALILSIFLSSIYLVFVGLGLTFWGALIFYIKPERYVSETLLKSLLYPSLENLEKTIIELNYQGTAVYLPPKYLLDYGDSKIFIAKDSKNTFPTAEQIRKQENKIFLKRPDGILLTPPGSILAKHFERVLGIDFSSIDLDFLKEYLFRVIIDELNIANEIDLELQNLYTNRYSKKDLTSDKIKKFDEIIIHIKDPIQFVSYNEIKSTNKNTYPIYFPMVSAIACIIAKITAKPTTIENIQYSENQKILTAVFKIIEPIEIETISTKKLSIPRITPSFHAKRDTRSILLLTAALTFLGLVTWIIINDLVVWGKDLVTILFQSRLAESISLGIDMKIIHYLIIGLAFLASFIITRRLAKKNHFMET